MENSSNKIAIGLAVVAIVIAILGLMRSGSPLAGNKTASFWDTADGYKVDGTAIIDGNGSLTVSATTTLAKSFDGFVVGGTISTAATGTVRTIYENTTGPKLCDADTAFLYVKNNGSFSPITRWSVGTSTTAAASTNLIASSTVATSTTAVIAPTPSVFRLAQGELITAIMDDNTNSNASSTYLGNISSEFGVWCQSLSI